MPRNSCKQTPLKFTWCNAVIPGARVRIHGQTHRQTHRHKKTYRQTVGQTDRLISTLYVYLQPVPMSQTALIPAKLRTKHITMLWEVYPPVCEMVSEHETRKVDAPEARTGAVCHHSPQACCSILPVVSTPYKCMSLIAVEMRLACNIHAASMQLKCNIQAAYMRLTCN